MSDSCPESGCIAAESEPNNSYYALILLFFGFALLAFIGYYVYVRFWRRPARDSAVAVLPAAARAPVRSTEAELKEFISRL